MNLNSWRASRKGHSREPEEEAIDSETLVGGLHPMTDFFDWKTVRAYIGPRQPTFAPPQLEDVLNEYQGRDGMSSQLFQRTNLKWS